MNIHTSHAGPYRPDYGKLLIDPRAFPTAATSKTRR